MELMVRVLLLLLIPSPRLHARTILSCAQHNNSSTYNMPIDHRVCKPFCNCTILQPRNECQPLNHRQRTFLSTYFLSLLRRRHWCRNGTVVDSQPAITLWALFWACVHEYICLCKPPRLVLSLYSFSCVV